MLCRLPKVAGDACKKGSKMAAKQWSTPPAMEIDTSKTYIATIETNKGTITLELYPNYAPKTVNNFVCLAKAGYFDGTPFHRPLGQSRAPGADAPTYGPCRRLDYELEMGFYVGLIQDGVGFRQDRTARTIVEVGF